MALDMTSFDAALKEHYNDQRVINMVYKNNPLLALIPKFEDFGGRNYRLPLIYGNPQGRSASFARAQTRGGLTASKIEDFVLTRVKNYSIATIDNETLEASKGNANAFMEAATIEIDGAINSISRDFAIDMYRSGFGDKGVIGSISSATIVLATVDDVTNFEVGQELVLSTTQGSAVLRALGTSTNGLIITGVNRSTGVLTFGYNVTDSTNGIPTAAAGDYIFVRGDREDSATPSRLKISGMESWVPSSTPASAAFFSVDRTLDPTRLAGQRFDGTALPIEEALIDGATLAAREGGHPDHCFMNYSKYASLEKALGSKVQYIDLKVDAQVMFRSIIIQGPNGPIKIIPDQNCPAGRAFMLQLDTWKVYSLGKMVRVLDTDGLQMLRQSSADGVEVRYGGYLQIGCNAPGFNVNVQL
jgi:hypothetical protein